MRRLIIAALVGLSIAAALPAAASASVPVGNVCSLTADYPSINLNNWVEAHGELSCSYSNTAEVEVCLEKNSGSGWTGTYNCKTAGPSNNVQYISAYSAGQTAGCGTWFRTWTWADSKYTDGTGYHHASNSTVGPANYAC